MGRTAQVMMGQPPVALSKKWQDLALAQKQELSDAAFRTKKSNEKQKKELDMKKKQLEKDRKKIEKAAKKKADEAKKKLAESVKKKEAEAKGEVYEPPEEEPEEEDVVMEDENPPTVELTAEEKKQWFRKPLIPDISNLQLATSFGKFCVPEKTEGLDDIKFEWQKEDKCKEYLKNWIRDRKSTTRIEDLQPSDWFGAKFKDWQKTLQLWRSKENTHKQSIAKKASDKAARAQVKESKKRAKEAAAKKKIEEARKKEEAVEKKKAVEAEKKQKAEAAGEEYKAPAEEPEPKEEEDEKEEEEDEPEEKEEAPVDYDEIDVFGCEDVCDIGGGEPLFSLFAFEDWTL